MASLDQDADELLLLARHLRAHAGSQGLVLMGHSTGCQDAARYAQRHAGCGGYAAPLLGVVLQGPVRAAAGAGPVGVSARGSAAAPGRAALGVC